MPALPNPTKMTGRKIFIVWEVLLITMLMLSSSVTARKLAETSNPSTTSKDVPGEKVFVRFLGDYGGNPTDPTIPTYPNPPNHP
ncbi:unnamed protein product [Ilex paraguariensis]|uniref:Transmembrane protein n=1 Tax=Ilex paraguariensis TaxID=185542 RepID=A0ABC8TD78_9AQUA